MLLVRNMRRLSLRRRMRRVDILVLSLLIVLMRLLLLTCRVRRRLVTLLVRSLTARFVMLLVRVRCRFLTRFRLTILWRKVINLSLVCASLSGRLVVSRRWYRCVRRRAVALVRVTMLVFVGMIRLNVLLLSVRSYLCSWLSSTSLTL